jgi:O-antigen ligase/tetratricopeptide (TPR) repeat protein
LSYFKSNSQRRINSQFKNSALLAFKIPSKTDFATTIAISVLIFLSIIPLASADAWNEAIVVAVIFTLSGINIWTNKLEIENRRLLLPLFILAAYSFIQGITTLILPFRPVIFPESFDAAASIWSGFKILAAALFLGLLLKSCRQNIKFLTWSLIVTGNFFAVFGIARFLLQPDFTDVFERLISPRLATGIGFGTYFNQNHFAFLMLMVFGLNICLFWYGNLSKITRFLLIPASVITWTALVLTGSRGGIISSFAEIAVLFFLSLILKKSRKSQNRKNIFQSKMMPAGKQLLILPVIFGLLIIGIGLIGQDRVVERFEEIPQQLEGVTNAATFRRTDVWLAAVEIIKNYPVFGIGFGGFKIGVSQYIDISGQLVPKQAHNDYLELAASGGIVAVALTIWFLLRFFSLVRKRFAEPSDFFSAAVRIGAICGISGVAIHSFFDFGLQITANFLFFTALLFLAIHKTPGQTESNEATSPKSNAVIFNFLLTILCVFAVGSMSFFGFARYRLEQAKSLELFEKDLPETPFDADYYETKSSVYENSGKFAEAAQALKTAIDYRPKDCNLWLKLAQIEQSQNLETEAEKAFRRTIELAPLYAQPHLLFGKFLVKINRKDEGFAELRFASSRNPQFFSEVILLVWTENNGKADELIKFLAPMDETEKEQLISFLFDQGAFPPIVQLVCGDKDLTPPHRDSIVGKFFEFKQYFFAKQVDEQNCDNSKLANGEIKDGGFDNKIINKSSGFGWQIRSLSANTKVGFDEENTLKGQSLRFDFNGQEDSPELLSQIVTVEKNRKYQLNFSYKTNKIVTGGVPILQIVLKNSETEYVVKETKLSLKETGWIQSSMEFETLKQTEAVEIRLTRQACSEIPCPIFGSLWLDDFSMQKKN